MYYRNCSKKYIMIVVNILYKYIYKIALQNLIYIYFGNSLMIINKNNFIKILLAKIIKYYKI